MADADVTEEDGQIILSFAGQTVALKGEKAQILKEKGYVGKQVTIGIRHENISEIPGKGEDEVPIKAETSVFEMLGSEGLLYFSMGEAGWVASVSPSLGAIVGDERELYMDISKMHIFDKDTEESITN